MKINRCVSLIHAALSNVLHRKFLRLLNTDFYSIQLCYPKQTQVLCHMLKEHRESYIANIRHSSVVAISLRYHRMHSHLLLNFASASKADKFPQFAPSIPLGAVCMSNPTWPAFSVHKGGTELQGHRDGQNGPELPHGRHLSCSIPSPSEDHCP